MTQGVLVDHLLTIVHDDHLSEVLLRRLQVPSELVEVALIERGEVVDDAQKVVRHLKDELR